MKLFVKCIRNGEDWYAAYVGMDEATVRQLVSDLGCTQIELISEEQYTAALSIKP